MRQLFVAAHRWAGLFTAVFLFLAGATGAIIAWDHELDALLNPALLRAGWVVADAPSKVHILELARRFEAAHPELVIRYVPLSVEAGSSLSLFVGARSGADDALGYNNVFLHPITGQTLGKRAWGEAALDRANLLPFIYRLHYSLHLPSAFGVELGSLLMGVVALVWVFDGFVALGLSFPSRAQWRKSFAFRLKNGGYRLLFDVHRSGGVWTWLLLCTLAVTAVSMNLKREVVRPLVALFSPLRPDVWTIRRVREPMERPLATLDRAAAVALAEREARKRNIAAPAGCIFYAAPLGFYGVGFFEAGQDHGDGDLGPPWLYIDDSSGALLGADIPGTGSLGDLFMQAQFPLHSGRIGGFYGRVVVTLLGLAVAGFSATGMVIWLRKRKARARSRARKERDGAQASS